MKKLVQGYYPPPPHKYRRLIAALTVAVLAVFSLGSCEKFIDPSSTYTVMFNANGGTPTPQAQTVSNGGKVTEPTGVTKTDNTLEGWYKEIALTTKWNFASDTVTATITLYAKWLLVQESCTINGVSVPFRYVPAGNFQRDSTATNITEITKGYWMSETEVTQELFQAIMGKTYSFFTNGADSGETQNQRPVEQVSWYDAIAFCNKLSLADGKEPVYCVDDIDWQTLDYDAIPMTNDTTWNAVTQDLNKNGYRLPTEMEWMWAAMGADKTSQPNTTDYTKAFAGSNGSNSIGDYAWYKDDNSGEKTHAVGKKLPNELGLYDMSGNVWEWCWDRFAGSKGNTGTIGQTGTVTDYVGASSGSHRVNRGGGFFPSDTGVAPAFRAEGEPNGRFSNVGFRLARF